MQNSQWASNGAAGGITPNCKWFMHDTRKHGPSEDAARHGFITQIGPKQASRRREPNRSAGLNRQCIPSRLLLHDAHNAGTERPAENSESTWEPTHHLMNHRSRRQQTIARRRFAACSVVATSSPPSTSRSHLPLPRSQLGPPSSTCNNYHEADPEHERA